MWPRMPDVWVPLGLDPNVGRRDARMLRVVGRLRPEVGRTGPRRAQALAGAWRWRTPPRMWERRDRLGPARRAHARRPAVALRPGRRRDRADARRVRQRRRAPHRRGAGAAARIRHPPGPRCQSGTDHSTGRCGEPRRRPARRRRGLRAGVVVARPAGRGGHRGRRAASVGDRHRAEDVRGRRHALARVHDRVRLATAFEATRGGDLRVCVGLALRPRGGVGAARRSSGSRPRCRWPCSSAPPC